MHPFSTEHLLHLDQDIVWHPYASMRNRPDSYPIASAKGVRLRLTDGRELIDGMSSWWCAIHGYNHPVLNEAAHQQIDIMSHVMFGGLTHQPAVELAKRLIDVTPDPLKKVFFCDSGSVSVEVAIKMALQYWYTLGQPEKRKFLTIRSGYHGDTFGAMSVCDPITGMHQMFTEVLPQHYFADTPQCAFGASWNEQDIQSFLQLIQEHHQDIAAVILEPIVQGAGGMRFYSSVYLTKVRELCDKYHVLLIFDEIATGFGRTGPLFACEHAQVSPDIMCLGKALTGGYLSLAATLCTAQVSDGISKDGSGVLMHGPTFMANPLACAIALASLQLVLSAPWHTQVKSIEGQLREELEPCRAFANVEDVRVLGAIGVVEMKEPPHLPTIQARFVAKGVWLRPFGKLVYLMPPYIIASDELRQVTSAMVSTLADV